MKKTIGQLFYQSKARLQRCLPGWQFRKPQATWEKRWSEPTFNPAWRILEIPPLLQEAVASGWFPPASNLLDIGCGAGECANWLAQRGFSVLGIDFASSAIHRARATYPEHERLQFQVRDICRSAPSQRFQLLFDRGCLHIVPEQNRPYYIQQIAKVAHPGAHFLLLHKTYGDPRQPTKSPAEQAKRDQQTFARLQREFQTTFEIVKMQPTHTPRIPPTPPVPVLAVWLVRR